MALPTLDATFASSADLPRRQMLAKWLVNLQYSGSVEDYYTLPEKYLYAKIAVAAGASRSEADYISLPDRYVWSDIYKAVSGSSGQTIDRGEKEALGWIAAAVRGDTADPAKVATYISWPWRYQVASIITSLAVDADAQSFITTSGATDVEGIDQFVKGIKNLNLWNSMVCWPLRSSQNAGTGTTAYSLGGLGTFNGTLVNGPTWGADGVAINGSKEITTSGLTHNSSTTNSTIVAVVSPTTTAAGAYIIAQAYGATGGVRLRQDTANYGLSHLLSNGTQSGVLSISSSASNNVRAFLAASFATTPEQFIVANGTQSSTATGSLFNGTTDIFKIGLAAANFNGTVSFVLHSIGSAYSFSQTQSLRDLYKTTLGAGLELP